MSQNSTFLTQEPVVGPLNCRPTPDVALYYDGVAAVVPALSSTGTILFTGAVGNRPASGIGFNGTGTTFALDYADILNGGVGVKLRCIVAATKQKLRITFTAGLTPLATGNASLQLKVIQHCANPQEYDDEIPIYMYYRAGVVDTVAQKSATFAARFNAQYSHLGTATATSTYVDIETLNAGERFWIQWATGIATITMITPGFKGTYEKEFIPDWIPGTTLPAVDVNAIELFTYKKFPNGSAGSATSNRNQATQNFVTVEQTISVSFASNTNGNAALAALKTILLGPASGNLAQPYLTKLVGNVCADYVQYPYTVGTTDLGDAAALATIKTNYSTAIDVKLVSHVGAVGVSGASVYAITTPSSSAPAAAGSDTVAVGATYMM